MYGSMLATFIGLRIKIRYILALLVLVAIIVSIVPEFYLHLVIIQAIILTIFGIGRAPLFYVQVKEDQGSNSNALRETLRLVAYFFHSILFVIAFYFILEYLTYFATQLSLFMFGEYVLYPWAVSLHDPVFLGILFFVSGTAFIFMLDFLTKLINAEEKIVIEDGTNE